VGHEAARRREAEGNAAASNAGAPGSDGEPQPAKAADDPGVAAPERTPIE